MEALVAVGLASNVLQFVDFATKLVSKAKELRQDAVSSDHKDYDAIAAHLQVLARKVGTSAHSIAQSSATASPEEKALQPVADGCCELARKLSKRLNDLDLLSAQSGSLLRRGKAAWRWVWNKKEIEEIAERLHYFGSQLSLHMTYQVRQNQLEQRTWQSSKDDVQATLARIDDVLLSTEKLKLGIDEKLDRQHEEVLHSFADLSVRNSQLQTQTIEEVSSASRVASEGIHGLGTSFNAMMLKQSEIFESLATVRVENSELHGRVTQVLPQTHDFDSTSLQYLLKSMLDEYQEKSIMEIRKEFRGTARSEMENLRTQALQALNEMQSGRQTRHPKAETTPEPAVKPSSPYASEPIQNAMGAETAPLKLGEHGRQKKNDISIVYTKRRWIDTRIGTFWFRIRDKVVFDSVKPPVSVYELTVHFTPSPRWCSKSFSVAYQKVADARGGPKFGLQLESYRVLDNDHEVWKAIREHDVDSVRTMLAERVISPYDHRHDGWALLSHATLFGNLDMVKALVHSGADINAVDEYGLSPICWAIMRDLHFDEYSRETFHYLQGLSNINYEGLWLNPAISIFAVGLVLYTVETTGRYDVKNRMLNWVSACHAVDCDVDVPGESFLETTIERFGNPENLSADGFNTHCHTFIPIFDLILDEVIGTCPTIGSEISMAFVALKLFWQLGRAWKIACIAANASDILTVSYHKYYVDRIHAETFKFLEHVMERAIEQRPDCIFDTFGCYGYDNCTICILFIRYGYWDIWADILEDNGFDPDWVDEEDEKRCLARTAKTSAHEVIADVDAARALEVKRRRGYVNTEE